MTTKQGKPLTHFVRGDLPAFENEIREALQPLADKYGLLLKVGGGTYDTTMFRPKVILSCMGEGGIDKKAEADWNAYKGLIGLPDVAFGTTFVMVGDTYTICGVKPRSGSPVLAQRRDNGKTYKFNVAAVRVLLTQTAVKNKLCAAGSHKLTTSGVCDDCGARLLKGGA